MPHSIGGLVRKTGSLHLKAMHEGMQAAVQFKLQQPACDDRLLMSGQGRPLPSPWRTVDLKAAGRGGDGET